MDIHQKFANHLDQLRMEHGLTIEQLCEDITTTRQYRRYMSGDSYISPKNLISFCEKLHLNIDEFYYSFYINDRTDYKKAVDIYKNLSAGNIEEAGTSLRSIKNRERLPKETQQFLQFSDIVYQFETKQCTRAHAIELLKKLIDYPDCTKKNTITLIEVIVTRQIVIYGAFINHFDDADILYDMLQNPNRVFLSENTRTFIPNIYQTLSKSYGMKGDLTMSLKMANEGITNAIRYNFLAPLPALYYYKSLCHHKLGQATSAYDAAKHCIASCITLQDEKKIAFYNKLFLKEQGFMLDINKVF